jgi:hypothetical protein
MITVRAALAWPLVASQGHRVGDVVEAAVDAEQVIGVTARLISGNGPFGEAAQRTRKPSCE